jgi:hypothetical protein
VIERLDNLKHNLPDLLNTTEANPVLFKVNKYNELFNPLDECLQVEINAFNDFITKLEVDIHSLLGILKGDMIFVKKYYNMIESINQNKVPRIWRLKKYPEDDNEDLSLFEKKIKDRYNFFNNWIYDGFAKVYDLSYFFNDRLFITLLPIYFQKKLPEGKASSDKIKLEFKLTKYDSNMEITEQILEEYKKTNFFINEFIFIKGLRLKGFEGSKDDDRDVIYFRENENYKNDALPVVCVSYNIEEYQYEEVVKKENENIEESEDDDEEEEEEINEEQNNNNNIVEEKKEEDKKEEEKKDEEKKEEEKKEEDKKEEDKKNVNEEIENKDIIEKENKEKEEIEKAKHEREIEVSKENTKINQKISIEETKSNVKTKKEEFLDNIKNKSTINSEMKDGFERSIKIKTRTRFYKKHCRLDIPFSEEHAPNSYNINEPYGYIEIRFNCEKDKQEEYFRNKQLVIELDK